MTKPTDLSPERKEFVRLYVFEGLEHWQAYQLAFGTAYTEGDEKKRKIIQDRAVRLLKDPAIITYKRKLIFESKLKQIDDPRNALRDLLADMKAAREDENWTALASLHRLRMAFHGLNKQPAENQDPAQRLTDDELIEALAGEDKAKAALIRQILGTSEPPQPIPLIAGVVPERLN